MISKRILLLGFLVLVGISFLFMVSAIVQINIIRPSANFSNLSGTVLLNATIPGGTGENVNIGNVTFQYIHWNGTFINISTVQNTTANQTYFSTTWDTTTVVPDGKNYTINVTTYNYGSATQNFTNISGNMTIDNTAPTIAVYGISPTAYANGTSIKTSTSTANNLTLSIYITDATVGMANTSGAAACFVNVGGGVNHTIPMFYTALTTGWCNSSDTNASTALNISGLTDGNKTINVYVNDTIGAATATNGSNRLNSTLVVQIDTTAPTATATCSPTTAQTGDALPCSCSGSDATSGLSTATGTSTSPNGIVTPSSTGTFTYTCTSTDNGGLTASASKAYNIVQSTGTGSGSGGDGGGSSGTITSSQVNSFAKITPGAASITKYSDPELGLKQIEITVNNEAQSVKVTVTKYDGKPAAVSVAKTGKVYQYMQIDVSNVADKLSKAKITAKVEKSWVTSNNVNKDEIVISKFDESSGSWNELSTTYDSENTTHYYYTAEVTSFSYFSISERPATSETDSEDDSGTIGTTGASSSEGKNLTWLWIVIAVVVLGIIWFIARKKF